MTGLRLRIAGVLLSCTVAMFSIAPAGAQELQIETYRRGDAVEVWASAELQADVRTAWDVLSDYDHLARFIPDMTVSRVLSRTANTVVVEQKGDFSFFFFRQPMEVKLEIVETPRSRIVARALSGSFREMTGRYDLESAGDRIRVTYAGRFVPEFPLPPVLGITAVRRTVAMQFGAMVEEIRRRNALAADAPPDRPK